jgi:bacteriophage exclusion system BrxA-like protein
MRYKADITAGALKLPESRLIADLLLRRINAEAWRDAIIKKNVLRAHNPATAQRLARLIRARLETWGQTSGN